MEPGGGGGVRLGVLLWTSWDLPKDVKKRVHVRLSG